MFATSPRVTTDISPASNDGAALGTTSLMWSDLFLASGAVINFNNGDVTITHSSNALAFAGADSGYSFTHTGTADVPGVTVTHGGTTLKWSHGNTNFIGSLGALSGGGAPFVAWHAEHSSTANTLKNSGAGVKGMYAQWDGTTFDIIINGVATASANFSSTVTGLSMTAAGAVTIASDFSNGTSAKVSTGTIELGHATDTTLSRSSAGVLAVEGVTVSLNSTAATHTAGTIELGDASDTTLSRSSAGVLAVEGVTVALNSTSSTHTAGTIELGAATDTTLSRSSAGVLAVEGVTVSMNSTSATHTAGTIELGAASDTTISRASAGVIAVEGQNVLTTGTSQTITKGFLVTPYNIGTVSSGTNTPDPANGNYQYMTNNGAHTLAVPASDCAIDILVTNGASAGTITISGSYTAASGGGGDTYNTTNANKFILCIRRINSVSTYFWKALQ